MGASTCVPVVLRLLHRWTLLAGCLVGTHGNRGEEYVKNVARDLPQSLHHREDDRPSRLVALVPDTQLEVRNLFVTLVANRDTMAR
jgi:hypothetical protein